MVVSFGIFCFGIFRQGFSFGIALGDASLPEHRIFEKVLSHVPRLNTHGSWLRRPAPLGHEA